MAVDEGKNKGSNKGKSLTKVREEGKRAETKEREVA